MKRRSQSYHIAPVIILLMSLVCLFPESTFADEDSRQLDPQPIKRVEKYIYKRTPQGELAMYVHFPKNWAAHDKRPAVVFFFGGGGIQGQSSSSSRRPNIWPAGPW